MMACNSTNSRRPQKRSDGAVRLEGAEAMLMWYAEIRKNIAVINKLADECMEQARVFQAQLIELQNAHAETTKRP